jgi:hypothetical protein
MVLSKFCPISWLPIGLLSINNKLPFAFAGKTACAIPVTKSGYIIPVRTVKNRKIFNDMMIVFILILLEVN